MPSQRKILPARQPILSKLFHDDDPPPYEHSLKDEKTLYSGSRDTSIRAWDVQTGQCTSSAKVPRNLVTCLKCLPGESSSSVAQGGEDLKLRVWDTREGGLRPSMTIDGYTFFPVGLP